MRAINSASRAPRARTLVAGALVAALLPACASASGNGLRRELNCEECGRDFAAGSRVELRITRSMYRMYIMSVGHSGGSFSTERLSGHGASASFADPNFGEVLAVEDDRGGVRVTVRTRRAGTGLLHVEAPGESICSHDDTFAVRSARPDAPVLRCRIDRRADPAWALESWTTRVGLAVGESVRCAVVAEYPYAPASFDEVTSEGTSLRLRPAARRVRDAGGESGPEFVLRGLAPGRARVRVGGASPPYELAVDVVDPAEVTRLELFSAESHSPRRPTPARVWGEFGVHAVILGYAADGRRAEMLGERVRSRDEGIARVFPPGPDRPSPEFLIMQRAPGRTELAVELGGRSFTWSLCLQRGRLTEPPFEGCALTLE